MKSLKKTIPYSGVLILSIIANFMIKVIPFKKLMVLVTNGETEQDNGIAVANKDLDFIYYSLEATKIRAFWRVKCYEQAIVALLIARMKRIPMRVDFGLKTIDGKVVAHAWTRANGKIVTGGKSMEGFVSVFHRVYNPKR